MAGVSELAALVALIGSISSSCVGINQPAEVPIERPSEVTISAPYVPTEVTISAPYVPTEAPIKRGFDWHDSFTLFEDGSGVNADGVQFCVWHEQALCSPRSPSETVPAGAQLEFSRIMHERAEEAPVLVDCTTDTDCAEKNPHIETD